MKLFSVIETTYDKFDGTVQNYLSKAFNSLGLDYKYSEIFNLIFTGVKGAIQNAMFYIEDAFTEQNVFRASRKTSVYSLAKLSGYEASYGTTANGSIILQSKNTNIDPLAAKIYIYNNANVYNKNNGLNYLIQMPTNYYIIDLKKPLLSHEFKIVQGSMDTYNFVAKGNILEKFTVNITDLFDKNYITVKVNGVKWNQQSCLYDMDADTNEYVINVGYENSFDIMFGNGSHGKVLAPGSQISVSFLRHGGTNGNIEKINDNSFVITNGCYDLYGNEIDVNKYINIYNRNYITGGTNSDSIKFIKETIGMNSRSLVLASEDNFKLFFKRFSFIGYVNCWSENNSMIVTATCLSNLKNKIKTYTDYYNLTKYDILLSNKEKQMVITTLDNSKKSFAGVTLNFKDPIIRKFSFICYVKTNNIYSKENIKNNIEVELAKYFINNLTDTKFIPKSDIIKHCLDNIEDIVSIDIDIISELAEECYKNNYYEKYELIYINGSYKYITKKVIYEESSVPGLDFYGNISLDSKLEIPVLQGGFNYYPEKNNNSKTKNLTSIKTEPVQVIFI